MIVGTAGHIDHGKTTLVRALTGVDTDRLPEEKSRGISIELGYAYTALPDGAVLGFVDVPGHERFVRTMVAGATGVDLALLVVAADDGVMPQTREHLNILALLGVELGAVALTKIDSTDADRVAAAEQQIRDLLAFARLGQTPLFRVSGRSGEGVPALRQFLADCATRHRRQAPDEHFRLAVDRSFVLPGIGTVVTGTVHSGTVRTDDRLTLVPGGQEVRVRGIHAHNRPADIGTTGQRCALHLAGVGHEAVQRGHWVVAPSIALATQRFDAVFSVLAEENDALRSGSTVHVHLGTAHCTGRAVVLASPADASGRGGRLAPGEEGLVQLNLSALIGAWYGDRFILRDASAKRTLGGGQVLDPFAPARYRGTPERIAALGALQCASPAARLAALVEQAPQGVDLARFAQAAKLRDLGPMLAGAPIRRITRSGLDVAVQTSRWLSWQQSILDALAAFHGDHPDELGPGIARLRRIAFPKWELAVFPILIAELVDTGQIRQTGAWLHLPEHDQEPPERERVLSEQLLSRILEGRFSPPWVRDLAKDSAQPEAVIRATLLRACRRGRAFQVVRDLFYDPMAIQELAEIANELHRGKGGVSAASFRDETGLGRKRAIQILEFFDRVGFTRRLHDKHVVRADSSFAFANQGGATSAARRGLAAHEHRAA